MSPIEAIAIIRKRYPRLRRSHSWAIIHSGSRQTVYGCLCGAIHTTGTEWDGRSRRHVLDWQEAHEDCAVALVHANKLVYANKWHTGRLLTIPTLEA